MSYKRKAVMLLGLLPGLVWAVTAYATPSSSGLFASPEEAVGSLITAAEQADLKQLQAVFGAGSEDLLQSGDAVNDRRALQRFLTLYRERNSLEQGDRKVTLVIGKEQWPFPIPIVRSASSWRFDTASGKEEIINRRIGGNELNAIDFCHQYVKMQESYHSQDRDGDGFREYARTFVSAPGRKNGLFWFRRPGEAPSPLGPLAAQAFAEGYLRNINGSPQPWHGYYFRILTAQGPQAPGGSKNYTGYGGRLQEGFALIAYPVRWGASGIMSFIVNQDKRVFEKDLGPGTSALAAAMQKYNPDTSWREVR